MCGSTRGPLYTWWTTSTVLGLRRAGGWHTERTARGLGCYSCPDAAVSVLRRADAVPELPAPVRLGPVGGLSGRPALLPPLRHGGLPEEGVRDPRRRGSYSPAAQDMRRPAPADSSQLEPEQRPYSSLGMAEYAARLRDTAGCRGSVACCWMSVHCVRTYMRSCVCKRVRMCF